MTQAEADQTVESIRLVRFGVFEADLRACELRKQGRKIRLQTQPCRILSLLLEHPGEVISREEFRKRLWPSDTFVDFDHSLNTAMRRLREVLDDSPDNAIFIETLQRRGYRFIAPVTIVGAAEHALDAPSHRLEDAALSSSPARSQTVGYAAETGHGLPYVWKHRAVTAVYLVATASVGVVTGFLLHRPRAVEVRPKVLQVRSLAVLPLEDLSGAPGQEYLTDGITDELIASLAKVRGLRVISRSSSMRYKGTQKPLSAIARELNVDAAVEGTVQRSGGNVRITAELVQMDPDRVLWAETYENSEGDIFALQQHVANAIVQQIRVELTPQEQQALTAAHPISPEAYDDYLKGKYYWNTRSEAGLTKAIGYFELATRKDPQYALAYAALADCYGIIGSAIIGTVPAKEVAHKAEAAAVRAMELNSSLAESQTSMATARLNYDWDWPGAERGFHRAIELNPDYATAHQRYSLYLSARGRSQESIAEMQRGLALNPLSVSMNFSLGWRLYMGREYDEAIRQLRTSIAMDPSFALAHLVLGQAYEQKKEYALAASELDRAIKLSNRSAPALAALAHVYGVSGQQQRARELLKELTAQSSRQYVSPFYMALAYAGLKKNADAVAWLGKAVADRSNPCIFLNVDPEFDSLRSDPKFQGLLHEIG